MAQYHAPSDYPVEKPVLTHVLAELVTQLSEAEGARPKAFSTTCRYSDAARCGRAIALECLLPRPPITDVAGEFRMWLGTLIHEHVMAAICERYGGQPECTSQLNEGLASGHADWCGVIDGTDLGRVLLELKTLGTYGFDKAIGLNRKGYKREYPQGPSISAKIQGALNAVANDCDTLIVGGLVMDAVSVQLAAKVGMSNLDRICAEWHYKRAEFSPWAEAELERMAAIDADLMAGILPERIAIGDEGQAVKLDPNADRPAWNCSYCRMSDVCAALPATCSTAQVVVEGVPV